VSIRERLRVVWDDDWCFAIVPEHRHEEHRHEETDAEDRHEEIDHLWATLVWLGELNAALHGEPRRQSETVRTLLELRDTGPPPVRVRAAVALLDFMLKAADLDFEARLSALEAQAAQLAGNETPQRGLSPNASNGHRVW
jgi:hypothetical protein